MKKLLSLFLVLSLAIIGTAAIFPAAADTAVKTPAYYEWNFDDASLNDTANGVYTANTGNNTITVKTPTDLTYANNSHAYLTGGSYATGHSVKKAERSGSTDLGNALYVCDRYLEFATDIVLDGQTAWKIEITGSIPKGHTTYTGASGSGNGVTRTALFDNTDDSGDRIVVNGDARAFFLFDNNSQKEVQKDNSTGAWTSGSGRIGQHRVQKLVISNQQHADGKWYLHYQIAECYNSTSDAWNGQDTYWNTTMDNIDLVFNAMGSNGRYITANANGTTGYNPYFSSIKIWEDTTAPVIDGVQLLAGTTSASTSTAARIVGEIDSLNYSEVGYAISLSNTNPTLGGANVTPYSTKKVYTSIGATDPILPENTGWYLMALEISAIPNANFATKIYVRPYGVKTDGTVIYGNTVSFTVNQYL